MLRLLVCAMFAASAAYPSKSYSEHLEGFNTRPRGVSSKDYFQQKELEMRDRCQLYGGSTAFENLMAVLETSNAELQSAIIKAQEEAKKGPDPYVAYLGHFCRGAPVFQSSFKDLMEARKNCTSPLNRKIISEAMNVTKTAVDYICYNEAKFANFIEIGGLQCTMMIQDALILCVSQFIGDNLFNLDEPKDGEISNLNKEEECIMVNILESRIKMGFSECRNLKVEKFVEDILDAIIPPSCRSITKID